MLEAKQSGNVVEDFTIGNTRIKICDDFCRTRTSGEVKEILNRVPMSDELLRHVREQAERQGVPFEIALAVIERESSYQPDAVSDTGDFGLMQINICNHRWLYEELGITDVMDPEQNIEAGLYILGRAFQKYDDPDKALMAYNMGDSGMKAAWSKGQHSSKYSRAVIETAQALKRKEH